MNINTFSTGLTIFVKDLYNLTQGNDETVKAIVTNHAVAQLDDDIKRDIKILHSTVKVLIYLFIYLLFI